MHNIYDSDDRVEHAKDRLRGAAQQWFAPHRPYTNSYGDFCTRLLRRFNDPDLITGFKAELYGQKQATTESVEAFILRKRALFERLQPGETEAECARLLLSQLHSGIQSRLCGQGFSDVDHLLKTAQKMEGHLAEEMKGIKALVAPRADHKANNPGLNNAQNTQVALRPMGNNNRNTSPAPQRRQNNSSGYNNPQNWRQNQNSSSNQDRNPEERTPYCRNCRQNHKQGQCRALEGAPPQRIETQTITRTPDAGNAKGAPRT